MLYKVRKNVFETNSSSMHSIAVAYQDSLEEPYVPNHDKEFEMVKSILRRDGRIDLTYLADSGDYGWGPDVLVSFADKLGYAMASFVSNLDLADGEAGPDIEFVVEAIGLPEVTGFRFPYGDAWYEHSDRKVPVLPEIDHQSADMLKDYIQHIMAENSMYEKDALHSFLFDSRYVVLILNDNEYDYESMGHFPEYKPIFSGVY